MFLGSGAYVASAGSYCFYSLAVFQPFGLFEALCWSWCAPLLRAEAGSRPGGRGTFLCFAKETYPKERRPCCLRPLRVATGQTCSGAFAGCAVELATRWRAALGQPRRVRSRSMRAPTRMPPRKRPAAGAARRGWAAQQPNSPTAQQPHGPLLRSAPMGAGALRRAAPGRAQRWPEGMFGCGIPSGCAEERSGQRIRARDCLSAAGASSSETPPAPSTAGCGLLGSDTHFTAVRSTAPSGRAEGSVNWGSDPKNPSQTVGSPFLW